MNALLRVVCFVALLSLVTSCAKSVDYSTGTGKILFPFQGVPMAKVRLTAVDPKSLKLKGYDEIRIHAYTVKVSPSYTARGYLFEGPKTAETRTGNRILFGHWLGGVANFDSNEREFFAEAAEYAKEGNVCVIPVGNYPWMTSPTGTAEDIPLVITQVNDYRIGLNLLFSRPGKRSTKAMVISHDYGAMFGILTAVADRRVGAAVIMAPASRFYQWNRILRSIPEGKVMDAYRAAMLPYDPISLIGELSIPILFQYAETDQYVSKADADALMNAATSAAKDERRYHASHAITQNAEANADRRAWVEKILSEWNAQSVAE